MKMLTYQLLLFTQKNKENKYGSIVLLLGMMAILFMSGTENGTVEFTVFFYLNMMLYSLKYPGNSHVHLLPVTKTFDRTAHYLSGILLVVLTAFGGICLFGILWMIAEVMASLSFGTGFQEYLIHMIHIDWMKLGEIMGITLSAYLLSIMMMRLCRREGVRFACLLLVSFGYWYVLYHSTYTADVCKMVIELAMCCIVLCPMINWITERNLR